MLAEIENQSLHVWLSVVQNSFQPPPKAVMHLLSFASSIPIHKLNNHQLIKVNMLAYNIKRRKKGSFLHKNLPQVLWSVQLHSPPTAVKEVIELSFSPLRYKGRNCKKYTIKKNNKQPKLQSQGKLFIWQRHCPHESSQCFMFYQVD